MIYQSYLFRYQVVEKKPNKWMKLMAISVFKKLEKVIFCIMMQTPWMQKIKTNHVSHLKRLHIFSSNRCINQMQQKQLTLELHLYVCNNSKPKQSFQCILKNIFTTKQVIVKPEINIFNPDTSRSNLKTTTNK